MKLPVYEIAGIGIGPFNLGLAALCQGVGMKAIFFEKVEAFNWHPGLLLEDTTLQAPFYADLVTPADPCNQFSYIAFLHARQRLFRFAIREKYYIKRSDYNAYCQWVAGQLPSLHFNLACTNIVFNEQDQCYQIFTGNKSVCARHIVIGVGTVPWMPSFARGIDDGLLCHSAAYLYKKDQLLQQKDITIIGSGQSAAEIFYDLLKCYTGRINWFTRSDGFHPMDYSAFSLEKTSLDYIDYFYSLPGSVKPSLLARQNYLYKGINAELLTAIYALLDDEPPAEAHLYPDCELTGIDPAFTLAFTQLMLQQHFQISTPAVILATGYHAEVPPFISGIRQLIQWDANSQYKVNRNYSVDNRNSIFVQNADSHTHGFNSADLGMGPYRNATILNTILGYEHYKLERGTAFQKFGLP